jgi:hypothetical protein
VNSICIGYTNYKKGGNLLYCGTYEATERIGKTKQEHSSVECNVIERSEITRFGKEQFLLQIKRSEWTKGRWFSVDLFFLGEIRQNKRLER